MFSQRPGYLKDYQYELKLIYEPLYKKPYPIAMQYRDKAREEIERMEKYEIIRRSKSPYGNPLVVVIKKDDSVRLCLDVKQLNKKLINDHESAQTIDELYQQCQSVAIMSILDLNCSF